jgi:hypothetical protein
MITEVTGVLRQGLTDPLARSSLKRCATNGGDRDDVGGCPVEFGAVWSMKVWPFGVALRGGGFKPPHAAVAGMRSVVSDEEKAPVEVSGGVQEDERE